ncbi:MAG TPA: Fur family transcriptional regulator [Euzebyales bacterium]|nr:Fur family transcriptional regulator [Euzebyales bacterium]
MTGHAHGTTIPQRLRLAGLRATQPRMTVLDWLDANPGHHPAEHLVDRTGLSKATVYHVLGQLCDAGLVLTAESGAGRVLYETAADPHHHFVCRACGRIIDIPCIPGSPPCLTADVPGATVEQADVILRGICDRCGGGSG